MMLTANLKKYRKLSGLSQNAVAKELSVVPTTISNYETGASTPDVGTLLKLAALYNVKIQDLLSSKRTVKDGAGGIETLEVPLVQKITRETLSVNYDTVTLRVPVFHQQDGDHIATYVSSNSLNAVGINFNDVAIIAKQSYVENGDLCVVLDENDEAQFRRGYTNGITTTFMAESTLNQFPPIMYEGENEKITIVGKVITVIGDMARK